MPHLFTQFDAVRIINLVDRADRRREMTAQIERVGGFDGGRVSFFGAQRPADPGAFPSLGARGCFESHLALLREARAAGTGRLLLLEDDLDFATDIERRGPALMATLAARPWDFFYGAHMLGESGHPMPVADGDGLAALSAEEPVMTTSFVAVSRAAIEALVPFLEAMLGRPAGSPDYGPMHVDGAYTVFRRHHGDIATLAAVPALGWQRPSRSDVTPSGMLLDRFAATRPVANLLRRVRDRVRG